MTENPGTEAREKRAKMHANAYTKAKKELGAGVSQQRWFGAGFFGVSDKELRRRKQVVRDAEATKLSDGGRNHPFWGKGGLK